MAFAERAGMLLTRHILARSFLATVFLSGCFATHVTEPARELRGEPNFDAAPYTTVCVEGPFAEVSELVLHGRPGSCDFAGCSANLGPTLDGDTNIDIQTSLAVGQVCQADQTEMGVCELPDLSVGVSYRARIDGDEVFSFGLPYASPPGARCWTRGGSCLTGVGDDGAWRPPEQASSTGVTEFLALALIAPDQNRPHGCLVDVTGNEIRAVIQYEDQPDDACTGQSREVTCHIPPLPPGDYEYLRDIQGGGVERLPIQVPEQDGN